MTRFGIMVTGYFAIAAIVIPAFVSPAPRLVWNASASVPIGLYSARPAGSIKVGDLVAAHAPAPVVRFMAERHYLPLRVPMLKHVAAVAGQTVCRSGLVILVDGKRIADARPRDRIGRPLPIWSGCRMLHTGDVLLLNPASDASFDGRYFGPVPARGIVAVLDPLWLPGGGAAAPSSVPDGRDNSPNRTPTEAFMINIGEFNERGDGFVGRLETFAIGASLTIVPATRSDIRNAPDYRVHVGETANGPEVGAGWKRTGEKAGAYVAIVIDDPVFPRPIRANLFRPSVEGQPHLLFWQRTQRRRQAEQQ